ncbi:calcium-binding protein, partial [Rhizobium ruizarguesonis]
RVEDFESFDRQAGQIGGSRGDNTIKTGAGNDTISGGDGADTLSGGVGDDLIKGEDGDDVLNGGDGNDKLFGGAGNEVIKGGAGDDLIVDEGSTTGVFNIDAGEGKDTEPSSSARSATPESETTRVTEARGVASE